MSLTLFCFISALLIDSLLLFCLSTHPSPNIFFLHPSRFDHGYALLMEDIGGTALSEFNYKKQGLPLDTFLELACKISKSTPILLHFESFSKYSF